MQWLRLRVVVVVVVNCCCCWRVASEGQCAYRSHNGPDVAVPVHAHRTRHAVGKGLKDVSRGEDGRVC